MLQFIIAFFSFNFLMMKLTWGSLERVKGWEGLNNAAINSFNSNVINSFVREIFQNSNDARRRDKNSDNRLPLRVSINYKDIPRNQIQDLDNFLSIFSKIAEAPTNKIHSAFFKNGLEALRNEDKITLFIYEDYNTTGLSGRDDEPESTFNSCILSEGTSVKADESAGGSYGIGKNSIYAFSKVRTVFYSSLNENGEYIFQGLGKLASYKDEEKVYESRVYYGLGEKFNSIRDQNLMPEKLKSIFGRSETGLSQFALCPIENENWVDEFIKAILRNYWPLLHNEELVVEIKQNDIVVANINKGRLNELMLKYYHPENYEEGNTAQEGNPYEFYSCFIQEKPTLNDIHVIGKIRFLYKELEHKNTNRIAYLRNGMVIQTKPAWGFNSIGYCGVVICDTNEGNKFLRMMEPHTHDSFDPSRISDKTSHYTIKDGEKVIKEINNTIRASLNEIIKKYRKPVEEIPWLNNLIKSIKGISGSGSGNRTGIRGEKESTDHVTKNVRHELIFNSITKNQAITQIDGSVLEPGGINKTKTPVNSIQKKKKSNSGAGTKGEVKKQIIKSRIFRKEIGPDGLAYYKIHLNSSSTSTCNLKLFQIGDSGNSSSYEIVEIKDGFGNKIAVSKVFNKQGEIQHFCLNKLSIPGAYLMTVKEPYKSVFKLEEI